MASARGRAGRFRAFARLPLTALVAALVTSSCMGRSRAAELYPGVARHQNEEIKRVRFVGGEPFSSDTLRSLIDSHATYCSLLGVPICLPLLGGKQVSRLNIEVVRRDIARLAAFYRREGYFGTRVTPRAEAVRAGDAAGAGQVELTFIINRAPPIQLDSLSINGAEAVLSADSMKQQLPLKEGQIFNLGKYEASADRLLRELQSRGYAYAEVLRNYSVDTISDRAVASLDAIPGLQVHVDSVIVAGAEHLGRSAALRQITIHKGDLLRLSTLVESQRNLYSLEIVQIASVAIAPDSMQQTPHDSSRATVLVTVAEAPVNQAEAGVGFGTVECLRADGQWTNRSFTGGARRLNVNASVSKIGLGGRTSSAFGNRLCTAFAADTFENSLDYRLATEFTQPYFLSPRNHLSINVYGERVSEPGVYQRQAVGGQLSVNHRLAPRRILTGSMEIMRARTIASPVLFCSAFLICVPEQLDRLIVPRFRNTLGLNYVDDHSDSPLDPTRGYVLRSGVAWATPWLSSSVTFTRFTGELAAYRKLRTVVLATSLRLGNFFQTATINPDRSVSDFLPPEERFYAGGATTVRGYGRNELGPLAYVTDKIETDSVTGETRPVGDPGRVPLGGTSYGVGNLELRFPAPLFRRQMRLAAFVDAGAISSGNLWELDGADWRFTPGVGMRIVTPVGPARVDLAYNPYDPVHGVLFVTEGTRIVPARDNYAPPPPGFFGRLRVHVAIGQAF